MIKIITSTRIVFDENDEELRRQALEADLERLADGWTPDAATLEAAPLIEFWSTTYYPGTTELAVQGTVHGHPGFPDGRPIVTSPICVMDFRARWMRSHNRFYRLGQRSTNELPAQRAAEEDQITPTQVDEDVESDR